MRIIFCIGVCVVQPVHHAISCCTDIRRPLGDVTADKEKAFPSATHRKLAMRGIAMMKYGLKK